MRRKFIRSVSSAAKWSPRLSLWAILTLIITILCHRFAFIEAQDFCIGSSIAALLALIGLALAVQGFVDLWTYGDKGGRSSIKGMILSLVTLAPLMQAGAVWLMLPSVYDVSSDVDNPPLYPVPSDDVMGRPIGALPLLIDFSGQVDIQMETWPHLSGRRYDSSPENILTAIETVFKAQGWSNNLSIIQAGGNEILLASVVWVPILGFASDVVVRLEDEDDATRVDMRVTARDLPHDFGFGAHTIAEFMQMLDREVLLGTIERLKERN